MATSPLNSDHRNNDPFSFLKWGHKSHANSLHRTRRPIKPLHHDPPRREEVSDEMKRVMEDRRDPWSLTGEFDEERVDVMEEEVEVEVEAEGKEKLWNLRPRNMSQIGMGGGGGGVGASARRINDVNNGEAVMNEANTMPKSLRLRGMAEAAHGGCVDKKKKERAKLWISLSKEEIEEDIFILTGSRPARKPKRRLRNVQKQLDIVFPGLSLLGATAESFKIPNAPPQK